MSRAVASSEYRGTLPGLRLIAEEAARAGGEVARSRFGTEQLVRRKSDGSEVSAADEEAQDAVVAAIRAQRPDDVFVAEETPAGDGGQLPAPIANDDCLCWVIDPIDGTRNYVRGIPIYACSVGAMYGGVPVAGAIYVPCIDRMYSASSSEPLLVNGAVHALRNLADRQAAGLSSRLVVGLPSTPTGDCVDLAQRWLGRFVGRNFGSTALHLAMVAAGELDGMLADGAKLWDIAAGWALVHSAGGKITGLKGEPVFPVDVAAYTDGDLPVMAAGGDVYSHLL